MNATEIWENFGPPALKIIGILVAIKVIIWLLPRFTQQAPEKIRRQIGYVAPKVVWVFGIIILLGSLDVDIGPLLALMATAGIGLALVFTPVGQNMIAGFLAGIDDVVREGDVLTVLGREGRVVRKGSLSLGVKMPDGAVVYLPNTKVVDDELVNHSRADGARIEVEIKLDHAPDRPAAVACMEQTLQQFEWRVQERPTSVLFTEIGANAMHYTCQVWIADRLDAPRYRSAMLTALVDDLEQAGFTVGETSYIAAERFVISPARRRHPSGNGRSPGDEVAFDSVERPA